MIENLFCECECISEFGERGEFCFVVVVVFVDRK